MEYVYVVVVGGVVGCSPQGAAMTTPAATKVQPVSEIIKIFVYISFKVLSIYFINSQDFW